jgi:hypothetical protein
MLCSRGTGGGVYYPVRRSISCTFITSYSQKFTYGTETFVLIINFIHYYSTHRRTKQSEQRTENNKERESREGR